MIAFSCHQCGRQYSLKPEFAGRTTTCSSCKQSLVVPSLEETMAPAALAADTVAPAAPVKIAFSCQKCAMKFSVKAEFAGRASKCPACKEPLVVPSAEETVAYAPPAGQIQGAPSSLARADVAGGVTLHGNVDAASQQSSLQTLMDGKSSEGARYVIESELARGGMGAVLRAVDCDIRREVAVKYLLDQTDRAKKIRFVEEAQITGQLEHPNIVPIHELGVDAKKRIFFSMKMVKGRSLAEILKSQRKAGAHDYSLGRLLNIFVNVCNGLAYAHSRGVVHRDLKPANVMVGDFGEVYVMDWGLAKVLKQGAEAPDTGPVMAMPVATLAGPAGPFDFFTPQSSPPLAMPVASVAPSSSPSASGKVVTSRELDADLTQEGSVLGTPVYMPPEQATGQIHNIDERSDVYSMGAILYQILTLQPPIDREGGFPAIVKRVTEGQIESPEKKNPERARAGNIPPELAAVAMKALALRREDRYQTIEQLRHDVERFMEGRSVSAKHDTVRETVVKLVKRNKGVSIATAAASVVLGIVAIWSLVAILGANARTQKAYDEYRAEQVAKREQAKKSVPAFVRAAKLQMNENRFEDAMAQVDTALLFDENEVEARFLRGQMLVGKQDYKAALAEFQTCLKLKPDHAGAKNLAALSKEAHADNSGHLITFANELARQKAFTLSDQITQQAETLSVSRNQLLAQYRNRIEAAWPGLGPMLEVDSATKFTLDLKTRSVVTDLTPLQGMKLTVLNLHGCPVKDLAPLKGMPLTELRVNSKAVSDLTPLQGMPLKTLVLYTCTQVTDLAPLKGMPLASLDLSICSRVSDLTPLKGMPLTNLNLYDCGQVRDLTPLAGMQLTSLNLTSCGQIGDFAPLKGMPLATLRLTNCRIDDLTPLKDMPLTDLDLYRCRLVSDLTPLRGMPLTELDLLECGLIKDLAPLKGMRLNRLNLLNCNQVTDVTMLKGMPLSELTLSGSQIVDLGVLQGMPLKSLHLSRCTKISEWNLLKELKLTRLDLEGCTNLPDLTPLTGLQLTELNLQGCIVKDLAPLVGMPLQKLHMQQCPNLHDLTALSDMSLIQITLPPQVSKGMDVLRKMKSLKNIDGDAPEVFWKKWDTPKAK